MFGLDFLYVDNPLSYGAVTFTADDYLAAYRDNGYYLGSNPYLDLALPSWREFAFDYGSYFGTPDTTVTVNGQSFLVPSDQNGMGMYFIGFTSDEPITSIRIEASRNDIALFNFYRSTAVPEPATWAMMIIGFGLVGAAIRRRRAPLGYA